MCQAKYPFEEERPTGLAIHFKRSSLNWTDLMIKTVQFMPVIKRKCSNSGAEIFLLMKQGIIEKRFI